MILVSLLVGCASLVFPEQVVDCSRTTVVLRNSDPARLLILREGSYDPSACTFHVNASAREVTEGVFEGVRLIRVNQSVPLTLELQNTMSVHGPDGLWISGEVGPLEGAATLHLQGDGRFTCDGCDGSLDTDLTLDLTLLGESRFTVCSDGSGSANVCNGSLTLTVGNPLSTWQIGGSGQVSGSLPEYYGERLEFVQGVCEGAETGVRSDGEFTVNGLTCEGTPIEPEPPVQPPVEPSVPTVTWEPESITLYFEEDWPVQTYQFGFRATSDAVDSNYVAEDCTPPFGRCHEVLPPFANIPIAGDTGVWGPEYSNLPDDHGPLTFVLRDPMGSCWGWGEDDKAYPQCTWLDG